MRTRKLGPFRAASHQLQRLQLLLRHRQLQGRQHRFLGRAGFGAGERDESSSRKRDEEDFFGNSKPRSRNEGRGSRGVEDGSRDDRDFLGDNLIVGFDLSKPAIGFCSDGRVTDGFAAIGFCGDG